jgi:hypothetical protein
MNYDYKKQFLLQLKRNSSSIEFEAFPADIQNQIIQTNSKLGLALIVPRSENFSSGYAQVITVALVIMDSSRRSAASLAKLGRFQVPADFFQVDVLQLAYRVGR